MEQPDTEKLEKRSTQLPSKKREGVRVGDMIFLAFQDKSQLDEQSNKYGSRGYKIHTSSHFVLCQQQTSNQNILLHLFHQENIDADLICFITDELGPFHTIPTIRTFGAMLFGIIASTFPSPRHQATIWNSFCLNTLNRLRGQITQSRLTVDQSPYITPFAKIYRRIAELFVGQSLLDVGSSFGFFPILVGDSISDSHIIGCDNNPDAVSLASNLAQAASTHQPVFILQDVLASNFSDIGYFDTVTAIHLLEHLSEEHIPLALTNMLKVTQRRLIIAVPYEDQPVIAYGHLQIFTPEKLEYWGQWCLEHLQGKGRYSCEEVMGGLLIIERE